MSFVPSRAVLLAVIRHLHLSFQMFHRSLSWASPFSFCLVWISDILLFTPFFWSPNFKLVTPSIPFSFTYFTFLLLVRLLQNLVLFL